MGMTWEGDTVAGIPQEYQAAAHVRPQPSYEDRMETYARQTRNAAVTVAWIVAVIVALNLAVGIWVGVELGKAVNSGTVGTTSSVCQSQGGTVPGC